MSIDFIIVGMFLIFSLFYMQNRGYKWILLKISMLMFLIGYFIGNIEIENITFNVLNICSMLLFIIVTVGGIKREIRLVVYVSSLTVLLYIMANYIYLDCNMYFSLIPFILIATIVSLINNLSLKGSIVSTILSLGIVEIFNVFFLIGEIKYMALFQSKLSICIIIVVLSNLIINHIKNATMRMRNEKGC